MADDQPQPKKLANTLAGKTLRLRKCGARLRIPVDGTPGKEVIFTCQREKHPIDQPHSEVGFVVMSNSTARKFTMTWTDEGVSSFRQQQQTNKRPRVRVIK